MIDKELEVKGVVQNKVRSRSRKLLSKHKNLPGVIEAMLLQIASIDSQIENSTSYPMCLKKWRDKCTTLSELDIIVGEHVREEQNMRFRPRQGL